MSEDDAAWAAWVSGTHEGQTPPSGHWRTWVFLGGRGAGKTRAGAEWVSEVAARLGAGGRIALVGATMHDVRAVMVEGPSGLMNLPFRKPPRLESSLRRVVFPGGAVGVMLSAAEPERLRGPQFHAAWGDEFCAWEKADDVLALLRMGLRLGGADARGAVAGDFRAVWTPKLMLTTTPKPLPVLRRVLAEAGTVRSHAPTGANAENLADGFLEAMRDLYGGTRREAQELDGVVLEAEGALFTSAEMARARALGRSWGLGGNVVSLGYRPSGDLSPRGGYERAVVAVDPPVGTLAGEGGDACGIVVVARAAGTAWVLDDRSVRGLTPAGWAARVARATTDWGAALGCPVRVVAEGNQGGDMVEAVLKGAGVACPVRRVQARVGKRARAEPVAALYEQGRVGHVGELTMLEEELLGLGEAGGASPDRADALVWAVTDLLIDGGGQGPRARAL